jgi:hypothetical protein
MLLSFAKLVHFISQIAKTKFILFINPTCSLSTKITEKSLKNAVISG